MRVRVEWGGERVKSMHYVGEESEQEHAEVSFLCVC